MYNDIFVSYFIPTVNSNPRCDTSCLGPMPPICNSVSGRLRRTGWETLGNDKKPTGASRARQSGLPEPRRASPPAAGWNVADCGAAVERKEHGRGGGLPGENVCGGIRSPPDLVLLHTIRPCCVTAGVCVCVGGVRRAICGGFTVLPNLPKPLHVIRDKDRGLSYSTSILLASQKTAHP